MADTRVFLGPKDLFTNYHTLIAFHPAHEMDNALARIAGVFSDLRHEQEYRPCVGGMVFRWKNNTPYVLMGVTASAALRAGVIRKKGERIASKDRSKLAGRYTFPKGGCEESDGFDGGSVVTTALREVQEETRIARNGLRVLGVLEAVTGIEAREDEKEQLKDRSGFSRGKAHVYIVLVSKDQVRARPDPSEMVSVRWVAPRHFHEHIRQNRPETQRVLEAAYRSALLYIMMQQDVRRRGRRA